MTNRTSSATILIAGAGIGGLTAALALLRKGFSVRVLEQSHQLGEVGAGLQLSANATRALQLLGVGPAVRAIAAEPEGKEMRLWSTGQTWKLFDLGQHSVEEYGYPYLMVYRPDLHRVLVEAVMAEDPQAICLNARVQGFEHHPAGVRALLDNGSSIDGAALVGADGVHSRVRKQLWGDAEARYSGCMAWRGVIPADRLSARMLRQVGSNWIGPGRHVKVGPHGKTPVVPMDSGLRDVAGRRRTPGLAAL